MECDQALFGSAYSLTQCDILEGRSPEQHRSKNLQKPTHTLFFLVCKITFNKIYSPPPP
jgi:hypothetical protein